MFLHLKWSEYIGEILRWCFFLRLRFFCWLRQMLRLFCVLHEVLTIFEPETVIITIYFGFSLVRMSNRQLVKFKFINKPEPFCFFFHVLINDYHQQVFGRFYVKLQENHPRLKTLELVLCCGILWEEHRPSFIHEQVECCAY